MTKAVNITEYTVQTAREAYAYQCWPPMRKSKSLVNITKNRNTTYKVHVQAKQGAK